MATKILAENWLRIDHAPEKELLAACKYALEWFEKWSEHSDPEHDFGGEYVVMRRLRRAIRLAGERA